jgi:uncharacterized RDD family membrane protein YckC
MICPSCKKSGPASFRCKSCGAEMMRGRYRSDARSSQPAPPMFPLPAHATAGAAVAENPYAAPVALPHRREERTVGSNALASREARLAAAMIDGVATLLILIPAMVAFVFAGAAEGAGAASVLFALVSGIALLAFCIYQITLLVSEGQTLGKKMMRIRIVNHDDGAVPSAGRLLGIRYVVNSLLGNIPLYSIVDILFIFGEERRCLHDHLAGTKVVEA